MVLAFGTEILITLDSISRIEIHKVLPEANNILFTIFTSISYNIYSFYNI